jgi:uncharacterized protein YecA (UPF0149 family)
MDHDKNETKKSSKTFNRRGLKKEAKTGRNWKCPCGSGKKYKFCCLQTK